VPPNATPLVIALAGPNGAGKSTAGPAIVRETLGVTEYVDADVLARGVAPEAPESAAIEAGRVMLHQLHEFADRGTSFAFETTLASRSFAPWIKDLCGRGWEFHLVFLWLPDPEFAVGRVRDRVLMNGHNVPENVIRRRYESGLRNFFALYRPLATAWRMYDNSGAEAVLIAAGEGSGEKSIFNAGIWQSIKRKYSDG
jgi:predicted ABC-type ATPase